MNNKLLALLLSLSPVSGVAEVISESAALDIATHFFTHRQGKTARGAGSPLKMVWNGQVKGGRGAVSAPPFYVFNRGANEGFVIVSGEDAALPVLAYATSGTFCVDGMPDNVKGWAAQRSEEITYLREQQAKADAQFNAQWIRAVQTGHEVVLQTPSWNQNEPYNGRTPLIWEKHAPTGCVATAIATVMGYYQWPDRGEGTLPAYTYDDVYGNPQTVGPVALGELYQWHKMPSINDNPLIIGDKEQEAAISTLMFHVGAMIKSSYNYQSTGAYSDDVAAPIREYMKYKQGLKSLERMYFSDERWTQLLMNEIGTEHPVYYSGYTANQQAGHAFVLDGYNAAGLFHVNWGWGGLSDGFYALNGMSPSNQGTGGAAGADFSYGNIALIDMRPCYDGQEDPDYDAFEFVKYSNYPIGLSANFTAPVQQGASFTVTGGRVLNMGNHPVTTKFCLAHTDKYGEVKDFLYTPANEKTVRPGEPAFSIWDANLGGNYTAVTIRQEVMPGDRIRLVYQSADGRWKPAVSNMSQDPWELLLMASDHAEESIPVSTSASNNLPGHAVATFSAEWPTFTTEASVEVFYAEQKDNCTVTLKKLEAQNGNLVIPAHTGVVLSTPEPTKFIMQPATEPPVVVPSSNLLRPTTAEGLTVDPSVNAYILAKKGGDILFHELSSSHRDIVANRSYLVLPEEMKAASLKMVFEGETTGIEDQFIEVAADAPLYDLSGRRVLTPTKGGIYLQNGKKFIVK